MTTSRTGGQSTAAKRAQDDAGNAGIDSGHQDQARTWQTSRALKQAAEVLEGIAQDWRDVANETHTPAALRAHLAELSGPAVVEALRSLAQTLAWSTGAEPMPCPACEGSGVVAVDLAGGSFELWKCRQCRPDDAEPRATMSDQEIGELMHQAHATPRGWAVAETSTEDAPCLVGPGLCDARDQDTGRACTRLENHDGAHLDGRAALEADALAQLRGRAELVTRRSLAGELRTWARDAVASYRTRTRAELREIATNPDARD